MHADRRTAAEAPIVVFWTSTFGNVRLHTLGFRNIKVHPLRSCARRGDRPEWGSEILPSGRHLKRGNLGEWQSFKANKNNEAFIDRICVIKVPYCLRVTEEQKIYEKLIQGSELAAAPCAPATLETRQKRSGAIAINPSAANSLQVVRMSALTPNSSWRTTTAGAGNLAGRDM
jgi:PrkA AAA domain